TYAGHYKRARKTHASRTIVQVTTEDGIVGVGETRGTDATPIIRDRLAPELVGALADNLAQLRSMVLPNVADHGWPEQLIDFKAYAAIDMALWDILGKRAGLPVYKLFGGSVRAETEFAAYEYVVDPQDNVSHADIPKVMADRAEIQIENTGARFFEFKIGVYPIAVDIATFQAVIDRLGSGVKVGIDANMSLEYHDARRLMAAARDCGIANVEEPVESLGDMDRLGREFTMPISSHCIQLDSLRAFPAITGVVCEPHNPGGMTQVRSLSEQAHGLNRKLWFRACFELGISWAAMCHMGVAFAAMDRPTQALFNWLEDDLIEEDDFAMQGGGVRPPDRPGLGVTIDQAALKRYTVK
ncbi:MAG: mandelate racemase/muconate lactonizing enzyme family protein, partial [Gammaproteobacteria bacterium]|nr:mandelate racemase/muconate lactonizing enzyme family protein [Gammaproteobacteria bacterium]